jgi:predicted MFS family arabinose efflux permease
MPLSTSEVPGNASRNVDYRAFTSVCLVFLLANAAFSAMPVLFSAYVDERRFPLAVAGMVATAETVGLALGSTLSLGLVANSQINLRRIVLWDLSVLLLAQLLSARSETAWTFAIARGLSGLCAGFVQSMGSAWIAKFGNSERLFAIYIGMTFLSGTFGMPLFAIAEQHVGLSGSYYTFAGLVLLATLVSFGYPRVLNSTSAVLLGSDTDVRLEKREQRLLLPAVAINFAFNGGVWVYLGRAGQLAHITPTDTSVILSAGMFSALAVTIGIGLIGNRFGRFVPIAFAHICLILGALMLIRIPSLYWFVVAVVIFHVGLATVSPYFLAALASVDPSGRPALMGVAAMNIGYSVGPWLLSVLVERTSYAATMACSAGVFAVCLTLAAYALLN